jgi:hypothetical protein
MGSTPMTHSTTLTELRLPRLRPSTEERERTADLVVA